MHGALYTIDRMYNSHKMAFEAKYGVGEHEIRIYLWLTCDLMCSFVRLLLRLREQICRSIRQVFGAVHSRRADGSNIRRWNRLTNTRNNGSRALLSNIAICE